MKIFTLLAFFFFSIVSLAQKQGNIWYFSDAGLDFNPGAPVALTNSAMNQWEGVSSIADANGSLLFYTDGTSVWNKNHQTMPNGTGLHGNMSATQSALIVQKPLSNNLYFIFTVDVVPNSWGFNYSIVDMNLNGGLGDIITKNVAVYMPTAEKLAAVNHSNGTDVWVLTHEYGTNTFYSYLLTSAGLNPVPVVSATGPVVGVNAVDEIGYLRISPDGTKAAMVVEGSNIFALFNFSTSTGVLSNPMLITSPGTYCYGVEFSPNSKVLYGSNQIPNNILQWDLSSWNAASINASMVVVNATPFPNAPTALGVAPDHKVYYTRDNNPYIGVINNPNTLGMGCNLADSGVFLNGKNSALGLPNMNASLFNTAFTFNQLCLGDSTYFYIADTTGILSVNWNFGDAISGINNTSALLNPAHLFSIAATFHVRLIKNYVNFTDTMYSDITIVAPPSVSLGNDTSFCTGSSFLINAGSGYSGYAWQNGSTDSTLTVNSTGSYWVTVTNGTCTATDTINLSAIPCNFPVTDFTVSDDAFCHNGCVDFSDMSTNNPTTWQWSFPGGIPVTSIQQNPSGICYLTGGTYNVSLIACNLSGCDTLVMNNYITVFPPLNFSPIVQIGDTLFSVPGFAFYQWYDSSAMINGANDYYYVASHNGTYSVQVTDSNGCNAAATMAGVVASAGNLQISDAGFTVNYSEGEIRLGLNAGVAVKINIELLDGLGQVLATGSSPVNPGVNRINLKAGNISAGIYYIRILSGNIFLSRKLIIGG